MEAPKILSVSVVPANAVPPATSYDWLMGFDAQFLVSRYLYGRPVPHTAFGLLREISGAVNLLANISQAKSVRT